MRDICKTLFDTCHAHIFPSLTRNDEVYGVRENAGEAINPIERKCGGIGNFTTCASPTLMQ